MAEMDIVPYIGTRTPADFDTLFDELEAARGSSASLSDAIAEKADNATTLSGYGITDAYTKTEIDTALSGKQDALSQSQLAAANSGITAAKLAADETALGEVINGGAAGTKNAQPVDVKIVKQSTTAGTWSGNVYTESGTTYTINSDGTITVDTTGLTAQSNLFLSPYLDINNGEWVVSGCPQGGTSETYYIATNSTSWSNPQEYGNGVELNINNGRIRLAITVKARSGILVFKPMLCRKTLYDVNPDYEPYAPAKTNVEITPALVELVDAGAKNCATVNNATYTNVERWFNIDSICDKNCVLSLDSITSTDTNADTCALLFKFEDDTLSKKIIQLPRGTRYEREFSLDKNVKGLQIYASDNYNHSGTTNTVTITNLMLCTKTAWDISHKFVPYCPSMQEMVDNNKIIDISSQITAGSGYTVESTTHLYYQNKQVFGTIAVAINSGSYSSSLTAIAKLPVEYAPARQYLGSCGFSTDQWAITDIGYAFIQAANASSTAQIGQISVKSPTANLTHMILNVCYPVQIDVTF